MENLPWQEHETIVTGDLVPITMADEEGDLSVILMQRRFDYQRGVAEVNMARIRPGKERKILLTATHYRLFGVDDIRQAAQASRFGRVEVTGLEHKEECFCKLVK